MGLRKIIGNRGNRESRPRTTDYNNFARELWDVVGVFLSQCDSQIDLLKCIYFDFLKIWQI